MCNYTESYCCILHLPHVLIVFCGEVLHSATQYVRYVLHHTRGEFDHVWVVYWSCVGHVLIVY